MAIHRKILRWLENELFEGNIQLGQDLPSDSEIARAIGVGRFRTREALRTLEDMDLVQLYNGRGKEMLVHLSDEPAAAASTALRLHMSSSRYPTRDLVQTRILLESWAIARIDPKTVSFAEMDEVLEQMEDFDLSIRDFLELLLTFHHQVMRCGGNELLVGLLASVRQPSFESMLSLVSRMPLWSSAVERLRAESRAIAEALKAGDAATARAMVIGQLRGMYSDAGIDLEQAATSANGLPGEPIASEFAPVDVDEFAADDFEADDFDDLMQDDLSFADVGALPAADAPVAAPAEPVPVPAQSADVEYEQSESEAAHVEAAHVEAAPVEETASDIPSELADTSAETTTGANVSASDKTERSIPAASQPAPTAASVAAAQPAAHSVSPDVPLSFATPRRSTPIAQATPAASEAPVSAVQSSASQTLSSQTPSGQLQSVPAAYTQEEAEGPAKVLRASTAAPRRRSGQIISPVRATIIKPVDRSKVLTTPAGTARPATVVTAAAPAESESAEKVLRAPARQEAPATEPAEPTRLEAAATIHDTYEKLPHEEPVQERRGIFSKMKRFFGVDVYEPEHDEAQESPEKDQAVKEQDLKAETKPGPQPVIVEEALARAEAERAERLKGLHTAAEEEIAEENAVEEVSVEEPLEEPAEASDPAQESAEESVETASLAEKSTHDAAVASSGSVLSHGRAKGSKKSKKKRR